MKETVICMFMFVLRHTASTRMIEIGASMVAASRILGHSDIKKTKMMYTNPEGSIKDTQKVASLTD